MVVGVKAVGTRQQYVKPGPDLAVLIGIVKHYDVGRRAELEQLGYAIHAFFAYSHSGKGAVVQYLVGLVAYVGSPVPGGIGQYVALCVASITAREHGHAIPIVVQQTQQILHMGGLARTAHGQIAHTDDGHAETLRCKRPMVVKPCTRHSHRPPNE